MENQLPKGVRFIVMNEKEDVTPGKEKLTFSFSVCQQCEYAPHSIMRKCQLCHERREKGLLPSRVLASPANAISIKE